MNLEEYRKMFELENKHWWFIGKHRTIEALIQNILAGKCNNRELKILDIGCGCGALLGILRKYGLPYGIDNSIEALNFCVDRKQKLLCLADIQKGIPFKESLFDLVVASDVLEHLDDDLLSLSEVYRVCRYGGHVLITVPSYKFLWSEHDTALQHKRRYSRAELLNKITSRGFKVVRLSYTNFFLFLFLCLFRSLKKILSVRSQDAAKSDFYAWTPEIVNKIFIFIAKLETSALRFINFPFGSSIVCVLLKE